MLVMNEIIALQSIRAQRGKKLAIGNERSPEPKVVGSNPAVFIFKLFTDNDLRKPERASAKKSHKNRT